MALENGGDDFISKPFHYEVVMAKIRSHLRRAYGDYAPKVEDRMVEQQGLCLYPERLVLKLRNQEIDITRNEAILLEMLMKNYPRVVSREVLLNKLWDSESYVDDNTLSVNTTRVRKKLKRYRLRMRLKQFVVLDIDCILLGIRVWKNDKAVYTIIYHLFVLQQFNYYPYFSYIGLMGITILQRHYTQCFRCLFMVGYLIFRYFTHRSFYERLANPMQSLDESVQNSDFAAISAALQHLLEVQYRHYQNQLQIQERK